MFEDFNLKQKDKYYLIFIIIFSSILVGYYINFNNNLGVACSDVYVYLTNALYFAGKGINSTKDLYLSPMICFITSIFFRLGFVSETTIYIVTGGFAVFGNVGFYLFMKRFFDEDLSLTGTIIYSSLTLYLTWLANGTLDIPAIAMTMWIALFSIMAIKDNPKYYLYTLLFIVLGFFTRYTVILTIPALLLYYVHAKGFKIESEDWKYIKKGLIIGIIILAILIGVVLIMGQGSFGVANQISHGITGTQGSNGDPAYNTDSGYYLKNLPNFISNSHTYFDGNPVLDNPSPLSWAVIAILIIGMGLWLYDNRRKPTKSDIFPLIFFILAVLSFGRISSVATTIFVLIGLYLMGRNSDNKNEYFMLAWIFSNFIFYSYFSIKVNRYILPIYPGIIYFVLLSIDTIHKHVKINKKVIPIILIALFMFQAFAFTFTFEPTHEYTQTEEISHYIIDNNPDYENMDIGAYNMRPYRWWLGENVIGIFSWDYKSIDSSNVTYYISNQIQNNLTNYTKVNQIHDLYLYEKTNA